MSRTNDHLIEILNDFPHLDPHEIDKKLGEFADSMIKAEASGKIPETPPGWTTADMLDIGELAKRIVNRSNGNS